ncbi:SymE family type I addiction module toxin [Hungatella sp. SB206]
MLSGQWLEAIGFSIGNQIEVEYSDDKIIVTKVAEAEENTSEKCKG